MKLGLALFGIIAVALATIFILMTPASDVSANDTGGCVVNINGVDISSYNSPENALEVDVNDVVNINAVAPAPLASYRIEYACTDLKNFTISDETVDNNQSSYRTTIEMADYADYGVGLWKVTATGVMENGDTCSDVAFINITGKSFLSTVCGATSLGLAALGTGGLLLLTLLVWRGNICSRSMVSFYLLAIPFAIAPTTIATMTNGDGKTSSENGQATGNEHTPQVPSNNQNASSGNIKFCLKISILAIGFAILAAFACDLLFGQMGEIYPTVKVVVLSVVLGLVNAIVLQSLTATFARRLK